MCHSESPRELHREEEPSGASPASTHLRHAAYPIRVSTLDLLLTRDLHTITHCQALDYGPSDHRPVMYEIEGDPPTRLPSKYLFHKADWKGYQQDIMTSLEDIHPLRTAAEVEEAAETIS